MEVGASSLESSRSCLCHSMILFTRPAANTDRAHDSAIPFERNTTSKNHDPTLVGSVNSEKLASRWLCVARSLVAISNAREVYAFLMDMSMLPPSSVHPGVGYQVTP